MDKKAIGKVIMLVAGAGLTLASSLVNNHNQDTKMKETIAKEVAKQLAGQAKES